jgi:hypothetical protein
LTNKPDLFEDLVDYYQAFWTLHQTRNAGFDGPCAITLQEISAFLTLFPFFDDHVFFVDVILALDAEYLRHVREIQEQDRATAKTKAKTKSQKR